MTKWIGKAALTMQPPRIQGSTYGVVGLGRSDDDCLSRLAKGSEDTAEGGRARVADQLPQAPDSKARAFPHLIRSWLTRSAKTCAAAR